MAIKIGFISLGCDKNLVDSEYMLGILKKHNYTITNNENEAQIIIINTCGFIKEAKQESIDTILEMAQLKKLGKCRLLIATGCLAQRYKSELLTEIPELDAVIGTGDFDKICEVIQQLDSNKINLTNNYSFIDYDVHSRVRIYPYTSFVKIAEGCDNYCSYCAIPFIRGSYRSRKIEAIKEEVKILVAQGVKEINLVAQDTTNYGVDIYGRPSLPELLQELIKIDGEYLIRILYAYPTNINKELLDVMLSSKKIANYLDIPLQHFNDRILRLMGRPTNSQSIITLIDNIRSRLPEITLRTTFIVGFPTETEAEYEQLLDFIREYKFDKVGVFKYSQEEDTVAAALMPQISEKIKQKRYNKLMKVQNSISKIKNQRFKGKILNVLIEGYDQANQIFIGRSENDAPFVDGIVKVLCGNGNCELGQIYPVKILETYEYDLLGKLQ
ncbi:Ribosomal protein S12 methylthiotransferase RimO [Tepidanaerobacter acetatoxydans Re1]|uniref:Ribosomal protein uS12 methylthiotransferase RimO n=1 Tax=Tepidanaerobacter acetatoxydans (strain DSM 21804 / JCM 16047 / Re1) TaxID=1209989 RepID=F4LUA2_TEPAE|nr:30S ribosomal protein S12 methylthiotransferase RimO [Tepidanaerobacter acetatoxydans]AEE91432.1 Ribosomal protein S12 methylthiotransferase rimO [Tepidanaerobacter acetatoxydans Re1]CCP26136.1 Ribosomal protein S12 methylthiotransferase RimO [Tepidanaerobacter acetatoxydans Re1]